MHDFFSATDQIYHKNLRYKINIANNLQLIKYKLRN